MRKVLSKLGIALALSIIFMMAEVERARQKTKASGQEPVVIEPAANDINLIPNGDGRTLVRITAPAEEIEVTAITPNEVGGNAIADLVNKIGSGKTETMGPFDPGTYNNSKGMIELKINKAGAKVEIYNVDF